MLELFTTLKLLDTYSNKGIEGFSYTSYLPDPIPINWIIIALIISFGSAYIAYSCNEYESPATRALSTLIGFFLSGFYLIYYFIFHVLFDRKCGSKRINNIIKNMKK
jgi:hypothetical protein